MSCPCAHIVDAYITDCSTGETHSVYNAIIDVKVELNGLGWFSISFLDDNNLVRDGVFANGKLFSVDYRCEETDDTLRIFDGIIAGKTTYPYYDTESLDLCEVQSWYGYSTTVVLRNAIIAYAEGDSGAFKSGPADSVICEYVDENIGGSVGASPRGAAQFGNPTYGCQRVIMSPSCSFGAADNWEGDRAYSGLLDTIQDIGKAYNVDFYISVTSPCEFMFGTRYPHLGVDRTIATGAVPLEITVDGGIADIQQIVESYADEASVAIVEGDNEILEVTSADYPFRPCRVVREIFVQADGQTTAASLESMGIEALEKLRATFSAAFDFNDSTVIFTRDLFLGDVFTAPYSNGNVELKVVGYSFIIDEDGFRWANIEYREYVR